MNMSIRLSVFADVILGPDVRLFGFTNRRSTQELKDKVEESITTYKSLFPFLPIFPERVHLINLRENRPSPLESKHSYAFTYRYKWNTRGSELTLSFLEWKDNQWQRVNSVKTVSQMHEYLFLKYANLLT